MQKSQNTINKEARCYWLRNRYDVMIVENSYIVQKKASVLYVTDSRVISCSSGNSFGGGHGGCDRMLKDNSTKYRNVNRHGNELYIHLCETCQNKTDRHKKSNIVR